MHMGIQPVTGISGKNLPLRACPSPSGRGEQLQIRLDFFDEQTFVVRLVFIRRACG